MRGRTFLDEAIIRIGDRELALPILEGVEGETAIDITTLRRELGITTFDRGFGNTAETKSAVTFIRGEEGVLRYRGYPIEQLAEHATFLEVAYLLQNGELPSADELATFEQSITYHSLLREDMKYLFEAFPHDAHPMQILASAVSAMATYYPDALDPNDEESVSISMRPWASFRSLGVSLWLFAERWSRTRGSSLWTSRRHR